ncbi:hypothetical protein HK104_009547 [Borealophlyctis nickersoniae]|nr:hypothetical protein HK104_009547 [Borealophlyctis nickersoniae]
MDSTVARVNKSPLVLHFKNAIVLYVVLRWVHLVFREVAVRGPLGAVKRLVASTLQKLITLTRSAVPGADAMVKKEVEKSIKSIEKSVCPEVPGEKKYLALPATGLNQVQVWSELQRYQAMGQVDWKGGKVSGAIYHGGEDVTRLITDAFKMFCITNPLHPEVFPGVRKMEAEVVAMVLAMYNGPPGSCGSVTSGGTESLLMAVKTYRDMAEKLRGVTEPEMVVPTTIHAAFDKASEYFKVKLVHIPVDAKTGKVDVHKVARAINRNTILIAGSAPNFPHGIIDDIPALAALAKKNKIPMHVDCCLGGFLVPFMEKAGMPLPHYCDFRVDGVTSISVDTHKYGFAPKGSSVIMYRSKDIRNFQYFVTTEWPGGVYASPSIAGSRPGALIAGCWAAMVRFGESGYVQSTRDIVGAARKIRDAVAAMDGLRVIGEPLVSVVAFEGILPIKTYGVADLLSRKGWHLNILQNPASIHIACTMLTVPAADSLIADIAEAVATLRENPEAGNGELTAIYGTAASVPDRTIIADVSRGFLDALTKI